MPPVATFAFSNGVRTGDLLYKPWGEIRFTWGTTPTTYRYTGQREQAYIKLYWYGSRWYDQDLGRFIQPDSIIPDAGISVDWDRFAYARNNPVRYIDPTGHWTEEELEEALGENWRELYFGKNGIFYGRDKLLALLISENTTDPITLEIIRSLFTTTNTAYNAGFDFSGIDALGARISFTSGGVGVVGVSGDVVLNLTSGEFSGFISPEGGILIGEGAITVGGITLLKEIPSNNAYRGTFKSVGAIWGEIAGLNVEGFKGGVHRFQDSNSVPSGIFVGVGGAVPTIGVYGSLSYSFEILTVDQNGYHWLSDFPGPLDVLADIGEVIWNDLLGLP